MKYKVNDIIINKDGNKRKVLEAFTNTYILSDYDDMEVANNNVYLELELDKNGYTLYQEPKPKIVWGSDESVGKNYWFLYSGGTKSFTCWYNTATDIFRLKSKNVFDTEKECEARLKEIMES